MIGYLRGIVKWSRDQRMIIEVNDIGYLVSVVGSIHIPDPGERIELYIYTYVREDNLSLYGFSSFEERELYAILLGVSGIGPKAALNILSDLSPDQFIKAILTENIPVLKQISGIGAKTAQRLILELKNKVDSLATGLQPGVIKHYRDDELYEALQGLGYSLQEIDRAISNVDLGEEKDLGNRIRALLSYLGRRK
jgi:holliday junction DNA helicase RuvA